MERQRNETDRSRRIPLIAGARPTLSSVVIYSVIHGIPPLRRAPVGMTPVFVFRGFTWAQPPVPRRPQDTRRESRWIASPRPHRLSGSGRPRWRPIPSREDTRPTPAACRAGCFSMQITRPRAFPERLAGSFAWYRTILERSPGGMLQRPPTPAHVPRSVEGRAGCMEHGAGCPVHRWG